MTALDEHGRALDAACDDCGCAITSNEAAEHDGRCFVCHEDNERGAERLAVHGGPE